MLDSAMAAKARQVLSRNAAASQPKTQQNPVPLPESAASLDWSNLVNVATKAIESKDSFFLSVLILCALNSSNLQSHVLQSEESTNHHFSSTSVI